MKRQGQPQDTKWLKLRDSGLYLRGFGKDGVGTATGVVHTPLGIVEVVQRQPMREDGSTTLRIVADGSFKERRIEGRLSHREIVRAAKRFAGEVLK
jgi:hypothetical protein